MTKTPHELLVQLAAVTPGQTLVDLGCGRGATLKLLAHTTPDTQLVGVDLNPDTLTAVRRRIPGAAVVLADLARPLPFADASTDVAISHNTLECLADPRWLLAEIARVLRPGGRAVLGHTDFETIVVTSADRDLSRRVCLTYAQLPVRYRHMANADPQLGRRLPGLVRSSPLRLEDVHAHVSVALELAGQARARTEEMATAVRRAAVQRLNHVTETELDRWLVELRAAAESGEFLFSETAYIAVARRPPTLAPRKSCH